MVTRSSRLGEDMSDIVVIETKKESEIPNCNGGSLIENSMISTSFMSEDTMAPNMELQLVPEKILRDIAIDDEIYFIIKWKNINKKDLGMFLSLKLTHIC